ncbi:OmpA family protein [Photobacterium nomapromontoriensis]|uniref:OmpA family protein n=1 Tax=Photobacterium nomapromontoriensis TaxID=2910237 RepID=UPI003D0E2285
MKTLLRLLVILMPLSSALAEGRDEQALIEYCNTPTYSMQHEVVIGDVTGIGHHRNGFLLVTQKSHDPELKAYLLSLAAQGGLPSKCIEYLDGKQLLVIEANSRSGDPLLARVYFDFDRANLTPTSKLILTQVAQKLAQSNQVIRLVGHTDNIGTIEYNEVLGLKRAQNSATYLIGQGVNTDKLSLSSQGEVNPIASNTTAAGRQTNRRVDIYPK